MGRDVRGWAKTISVLSFFLLLMATVAWSSAAKESEKYLDPSQFNEAVVGPGESVSVNLSSTSLVGQRQYLVMRIVEDGSPMPDVRLMLGSDDCEWTEPGFLNVDIQLESDAPKFRTVRVFTPGESGTYVLHNDAEEGDLWLVDDIKSQTMIMEENPISIMIMVSGCCLGGTFGMVGLILAFIGWRRGDASVEVKIEAPLMTTAELFRAYNQNEGDGMEVGLVPGPFTDEDVDSDSEVVPEVESRDNQGNWENWDNG